MLCILSPSHSHFPFLFPPQHPPIFSLQSYQDILQITRAKGYAREAYILSADTFSILNSAIVNNGYAYILKINLE